MHFAFIKLDTFDRLTKSQSENDMYPLCWITVKGVFVRENIVMNMHLWLMRGFEENYILFFIIQVIYV